MQEKSKFLENDGLTLTNSKTCQGLMNQIAILNGELEEKKQTNQTALLNIIGFKTLIENSSCSL